MKNAKWKVQNGKESASLRRRLPISVGVNARLRRAAVAAVLALFVADISAAEPAPKYESGFHTFKRIGEDLYRSLPTEKRRGLQSTPVLLEKIKAPYLQMSQGHGSNSAQVIFVSPGLIDLLNYVSHAKAVEHSDPGYYLKAVNRLAGDNAGSGLAPLDQLTHKKAWSFNTMNWQMSHFNQMAGGLLGIEMAHHYLGHYKKYAPQLGDPEKPAPLYSVLTQKEWREAVLAGSRHALDCGLAPEGLVVLYDAITRMPQRPSWAVQIMPPSAEVSILRLELRRVEATFFDARSSARDDMKWSW